jgi:multidrug resistance protein MdtO
MTCSPRLSYLGLQIAFAFDLIHLQSFKLETSLAIARDRVCGVLLGLAAMWLVFDQLWSSTAGVLMKRSLVRSLRLLAQLAREPVLTERNKAMNQILALRETISSTLDRTQSFSDGVLFEFGAERRTALQLREHVRRLQPQLRSLFVMRISAVEYKLRLPGFEAPRAALDAQKAFDECEGRVLEQLADEIETGTPRQSSLPECLSAWRPELFDSSHLALLHGLDGLTSSLAAEIDNEVIQLAARLK